MVKYDRLSNALKRCRVQLKDELIFVPQSFGDVTYYHIEIPSTSKFFKIGYAEYVFISLLDGETSFSHALAISSQSLGADAISQHQATQVLFWLLENGLAVTTDSSVAPSTGDEVQQGIWQRINPFWMKLPLGKPDKLLDRAHRWLGWMFHRAAIFISLLTMVIAVVMLATEWDKFAASAGSVFSTSNWVWMLVAWVALKIVHEFAHAIVCKRFGGTVKETGVIFILFAPLAYVDVTSSWRFQSRWRRIAVAAAGMYVELLIAAVCLILWCYTRNELVAYHMLNVVMMASISTLLFNANPLMRFDGYFMLADFLGIHNLYQEGSTSVTKNVNWIFYGQHQETTCRQVHHWPLFVGVYGFACAIWKVLIFAGLFIMASVMFGGWGILLCLLGAFSLVLVPLWKMIKDLSVRSKHRPESILRAAAVSAVLLMLIGSLWWFVPNSFAARNPCVVDFRDSAKIRAHSAGFVAEILVEAGQTVESDQPLLRMENRELETEVAQLRARLKQREVEERIAKNDDDPAAAQVARENRYSIVKMLQEKQAEYDRLLVRSPIEGNVVARDLADLKGSYFGRGEFLLSVADEADKEIVISVSSDNLTSVTELVGKSIPVELGSRKKIMATIARVDPLASVQLREPKLASPNGGTLAVKPIASDQQSENERFELLKPRFHVVANINSESSRHLFCGERGMAMLASNSPTLGKWAYSNVKSWLNQMLDDAKSN
jgi:putative peptide zinc metalloprotease protein